MNAMPNTKVASVGPGSMRVMVTGAGGFIGRHLVRRLIEDGHCVAAASPELVYHLASTPLDPGIPDSEHQRVIVGGMRRLLDDLSAAPPRRLVFTGSAAEYGPGHGWREEDVPRPDTFFGACKLEAGEMARRSPIASVHLRLFTPFGEGEARRRLIPTAARAALAGERWQLRSDGTQTRDYFHVDDAVEALVQAGRRELAPGVVINICSGVGRRAIDVARRLGELAGAGARVEPGLAPPRELAQSSGDGGRAEKLLGWRPRIGFDDGLRRSLAWWAGQSNEGETAA